MNVYTFDRRDWRQVMYVERHGGAFLNIGELFVTYTADRPLHEEWRP